VFGVNLYVAEVMPRWRGEIVLLTDGNGSGKSTVLKTIYGLLELWTLDGRGYFAGDDMTALPVTEVIRRSTAYMPQKKHVFEGFIVGGIR